MDRLRQIASVLMLLTGVTHTAHFVLWAASDTNTPIAAGFGFAYLVIGGLLLRPGSIGLWLGAVLPAIGAVLGGLVALANPGALSIFHAAINWIVFPSCIYLLFQDAPASADTAD